MSIPEAVAGQFAVYETNRARQTLLAGWSFVPKGCIVTLESAQGLLYISEDQPMLDDLAVVAAMPAVSAVILSRCYDVDDALTQLDNMKSLRHLELHRCHDLSRKVVAGLVSNIDIEHLGLVEMDCSAVDLGNVVAEGHHLKSFALHNCSVGNGMAYPQTARTGLERIHFVTLSDSVWPALSLLQANVTSLKTLVLGGAGHGALFEGLGRLPAIEALTLTDVDSVSMSELESVLGTRVQELRLVRAARFVDGNAVHNGPAFSELRAFALSHCRDIDADAFEDLLVPCKSLTDVNLRGSAVGGLLSRLPCASRVSLKKLCLARTELSDSDLSSLALFTGLSHLDLSEAALGGVGLHWLPALQDVEVLRLIGCGKLLVYEYVHLLVLPMLRELWLCPTDVWPLDELDGRVSFSFVRVTLSYVARNDEW